MTINSPSNFKYTGDYSRSVKEEISSSNNLVSQFFSVPTFVGLLSNNQYPGHPFFSRTGLTLVSSLSWSSSFYPLNLVKYEIFLNWRIWPKTTQLVLLSSVKRYPYFLQFLRPFQPPVLLVPPRQPSQGPLESL